MERAISMDKTNETMQGTAAQIDWNKYAEVLQVVEFMVLGGTIRVDVGEDSIGQVEIKPDSHDIGEIASVVEESVIFNPVMGNDADILMFLGEHAKRFRDKALAEQAQDRPRPRSAQSAEVQPELEGVRA